MSEARGMSGSFFGFSRGLITSVVLGLFCASLLLDDVCGLVRIGRGESLVLKNGVRRLYDQIGAPPHKEVSGELMSTAAPRPSSPGSEVPQRVVKYELNNKIYNGRMKRTNRKSKYSPVKRRLRDRNQEEGGEAGLASNFATGLDKGGHVYRAINLAHQGKAAEALECITDAVELQTLQNMAEKSEDMKGQKKKVKRIALKDFNVLIKELGDSGSLDECEGVLSLMKLCEVKPSIVTYSTLISRAGSWQKVHLAENYFDLMLRDGIKADVLAYNSLINAYAKKGLTDMAVQMLARMDSAKPAIRPSVVTFNTLIDASARTGSVQQAKSMMEELIRRGLKPNERTYSSIVHAYCQAGMVDEAGEEIVNMEKSGIKATAVTYSLLLHALGQKGQLNSAFAVLTTMKSLGMKPNVVTMSSLIDACGKNDQLEMAFSLFESMKRDHQLKPNSITYSTLVDACLKSGKVERAFAVVKEMRSAGMALTEVTYTSLISELTRLKQLDRIMDILQVGTNKEGGSPKSAKKKYGTDSKHSASGFFPASAKSFQIASTVERSDDNWHYEPIRRKDWDLLWELYGSSISPSMRGELERLQERAEEVDDALRSLSHVVRHKAAAVCSKDTPRETLEDMLSLVLSFRDRIEDLDSSSALILNLQHLELPQTEQGRADEKACGILLRVYGRYLSLKRALPIVCTLSRSDDPEKRDIYVKKIGNIFGRMNPHSLTVASFEHMKKKGEILNARVYNELIRSLSGDKKVMQDHELFRLYLVFQDMGMEGVEADTSTYNTLINACAGVGDVDKALETLEVMRQNTCEPDVITYTSLIKACSISGSQGSVALAETLFQEMQQRTNHFSTYISPTEYTYLRLIQTHLACPEEADIARVWELLDLLLLQNSSPSVYTWRTAVQASVFQGDVARAVRLLQKIRDSTDSGYDEKAWLAAIDACSNDLSMSEVGNILRDEATRMSRDTR